MRHMLNWKKVRGRHCTDGLLAEGRAVANWARLVNSSTYVQNRPNEAGEDLRQQNDELSYCEKQPDLVHAICCRTPGQYEPSYVCPRLMLPHNHERIGG